MTSQPKVYGCGGALRFRIPTLRLRRVIATAPSPTDDVVIQAGFKFQVQRVIYATQPYKVGDTVMIGVIKEVLTANHSHASQIDEHTYVLHAGLISKVNHCCEPNCGIHVNETGAHDFVAMRNIGINEEATFDYAMRNYSIDHFPKGCMCGE